MASIKIFSLVILAAIFSLGGSWLFIGSSGVALDGPDVLCGSNLKFWVKADQITGKSDGDNVTSWSDQSGNGYNLSEATNPPIYKASIQNGKAVVRFNGTSQFMTGTTLSNVISLSAQSTWFVLAVTATPSSNHGNGYRNDAIYSENGGGNSGLYLKSTGVVMFEAYAPGAVQLSVNYSTIPTFSIYHVRHESGNAYLSIDNGTEQTAAATDFSAAGALLIGKSSTIPEFGQVDIGEIVFCNNAVSGTNRTAMQAYLKDRWATP